MSSQSLAKTFCGSPAYLAPEMVQQQGVGWGSDIYQIGAILYFMLAGKPPFCSNDLGSLYQEILAGGIKRDEEIISEVAFDLITKLMEKEPGKRIGVVNKEEIKKHEFFEGIKFEVVQKLEYHAPVIQLEDNEEFSNEEENEPVSYTHLTLPTKRIVQISVGALSLKKKRVKIIGTDNKAVEEQDQRHHRKSVRTQ
eukprot:TRINITY_DN29296_c0_g1_i1.p1 TRINITY_DN29296_c0_g1~~TRINITY_DN29296_c0_g1_i1.p1  ORF type:complete len:196 (-),score=33.07 TRINITY_DN29296_c0_g1_i1:15-602(-)